MGLMQVMPGTYDELRYAHGLGGDPYDPHDNIMAGTAYIREMYDLYGYPGFLGAYNAGPERYRQYVEEGRPLPRETRRYMDIIAPQIAGILPGQDGGSDRMTQYAENQIQQKVPAPIRMAPIPDGSSTRNTVVVAAMKPIPDGSSTRNTTVVAAMQPIPDGSSTALPPVRVVQPGPVQMRPIPDGATTQVAAAAPAARPAVVPAPVRMAPIPDGSTQVAAVAPAVRPAAPAPVRMAPIPDAPAARAPAPQVQVAAVAPAPVPAARTVAPTRMAPIPDAPPVRTASAKTTGRAQPFQQVADAGEPRRQANGLPAGWFVPSAPGK
jgi:hypothetical protein